MRRFDNRLGLGLKRTPDVSVNRSLRAFSLPRAPSGAGGDAARIPFIRWPGRANLGFMDAAELVEELRRLHREAKILVSICICVATQPHKHRCGDDAGGMQGFRELFAGANPAKTAAAILASNWPTPSRSKTAALASSGNGYLNDLPDWLR